MTHRPSSRTRTAWGLAGLTALLLAACGGGSDGGTTEPPPPVDQVPQSATASVQALDTWSQAQAMAPMDHAEPLKMDLVVTLPTSETAEPVTLP